MVLNKILTLDDDSKLHKIPLAELFTQLGVDEKGLSSEEVKQRIKQCGKNRLTEKKKTPYIIRFLLEFKNLFSILLLTGSALSFVSEWV
jgi:sodium/potassium-transporting ATPase subunit alpha